ncbi:MAG: hypothetical protein J6D08_01610 [Lachnospiraceae bacterium]|nr:hypothetical protein [Lachnospiraceae bacterium]
MAYSVNEMTCRGCGAPLDISDTVCKYCHGPVHITTIQSVYTMAVPQLNKYANSYRKELVQDPDNAEANKAAAFCYLKLKLYDKALPFFEKAVQDNFDDADLYLYTAVCLLKGKRPFLHQKKVIDMAIEYGNSACMIENKGIYHYFLAYLKYDYYQMKGLKVSPDYREELSGARQAGLSQTDVAALFELLGTNRPDGF